MIRILDMLFALIALFIFSIPAAILAILIKLSSPGPILYWSWRVGKDEVLFLMPKFRTMRQDTPEVSTDLLENPRKYLTPIGSFLRRSSLDELPQFWSVLCGKMSLVGPRPALFNQAHLIALRQSLGVNALLPGITGWAQVNGRDELSDEDKAFLDAHYLKTMSLKTNLQIIWITLRKVILKENVSH